MSISKNKKNKRKKSPKPKESGESLLIQYLTHHFKKERKALEQILPKTLGVLTEPERIKKAIEKAELLKNKNIPSSAPEEVIFLEYVGCLNRFIKDFNMFQFPFATSQIARIMVENPDLAETVMDATLIEELHERNADKLRHEVVVATMIYTANSKMPMIFKDIPLMH